MTKICRAGLDAAAAYPALHVQAPLYRIAVDLCFSCWTSRTGQTGQTCLKARLN